MHSKAKHSSTVTLTVTGMRGPYKQAAKFTNNIENQVFTARTSLPFFVEKLQQPHTIQQALGLFFFVSAHFMALPVIAFRSSIYSSSATTAIRLYQH